ncbi:MAG: DMT family transporter [Candidatus Thermoplasmatota archaeon]|uniref:DMT family transporter n=2 Tax=Candidatus Sysuiplasma superficiale TaxID=2823368 RepID=A0A8J8CDX8_9ARCH|nr:DMT family transporter [Candidatus Sysuiplasma superficiale]MCL4346902.1 DMT family transporter [Candidatus Thermoplasmatota archaeon]
MRINSVWMNGRIIVGSVVAVAAAFVWSTYYIFLHMLGSASSFALFAYPSVVGGLSFIAFGFFSGGGIKLPSRKADIFVPATGYLSSQIVIILSARINGGVLTSTFILVGDAILSPVIIFALGRNRFVPNFSLFLPGLLVLVASAIALSVYGGRFGVHSLPGLILIIADPVLISFFYVYINGRIQADGMARILSPTFLVSALISLPLFLLLDPGTPLEVPGMQELFILLIIGITSMFAGYYLFFVSSRISGFTLASVLMSMIPVFTLLLGALFIAIPLTAVSLLLVILAVSGASLCTISFGEGQVKEAK